MNADVIVIGAGLSGLACALTLREEGLEPLVLESSGGVGGRVRTDQREGYLLDRGFQVLQTWYPEAQRFLDYERLDLRAFYPGALVRMPGELKRVSDVWRRPARLLEMLFSPIGTLADKVRLLGLRRHCLRGELETLYSRPEQTARELLRKRGFSQRIIQSFFEPFFGGVFFEPELEVSSRAFEFVFRAFALGDTALPARGMGEIPTQLAARLPHDQVRTGCRVERIADRQVLLDSGQRLRARAIVIATEARETLRLLGRRRPTKGASRGTSCFYFGAPRPPIEGPYLVLNAEGQGHINSLLFPSSLSEHYAPRGRSLVSVNVHGANRNPDTLETDIRRQLVQWFGDEVRHWRRLAVYRIPHALPSQRPPVHDPSSVRLRHSDWLWTCGEYQAAPSIQWALHSGRRAGTEVATTLLGRPAERETPKRRTLYPSPRTGV